MAQQPEMNPEQLQHLLQASIVAARNAHAAYSGYKVGAALLLKSGQVVPGCNVENCAYPDGSCAEKTAVCAAVAQGHREFAAIAVSTPCRSQDPDEFPRMCGSCRQLLCEFCPDEFPIYLVRQGDGRYEKRLLGDYLPGAFRPTCLDTLRH